VVVSSSSNSTGGSSSGGGSIFQFPEVGINPTSFNKVKLIIQIVMGIKFCEYLRLRKHGTIPPLLYVSS
jgi:hypothetical protein